MGGRKPASGDPVDDAGRRAPLTRLRRWADSIDLMIGHIARAGTNNRPLWAMREAAWNVHGGSR